MATFMNYVNVYAFRNGVQPDRREAWTADRSPTLRGHRGGIEHPSLLAYLSELRQRVETQQPLCETTPNIYLDIPVTDDVVVAPSAPRAAVVTPLLASAARGPVGELPSAPSAPAPPATPLRTQSPGPPAGSPAPRAQVQFTNQTSDPAESVRAGRPTEASPLFPVVRTSQRPSL